MRSIKRLFATVSAGFDGFVEQVENHEAVAAAVLDDIRGKAARLKVQLGRVDGQIARLAAQQDEALAEQARWRERALKVADQDEARGIECARRAREARARAERFEKLVGEHRATRRDLERELRDVEVRLGELELKKTLLSSRGARADALRQSSTVESAASAEAVFERWETQVTRDEYLGESPRAPSDPLSAEFDAEEEEAAVREELAAWRQGRRDPGHSA